MYSIKRTEDRASMSDDAAVSAFIDANIDDTTYINLVRSITDDDFEALKERQHEVEALRNTKDASTGYTLLHVAVSLEKMEAIQLLVESGFCPETTTASYIADTCFHLAARSNNADLMELLAPPSDPRWELPNSFGQTPTHSAVLVDAKVSLQYLLRARFALSRKDSYKWTPLHYIALTNSLASLNLILGTNPSVETLCLGDRTGKTALHYLAINSPEKVAELCVDPSGVDPAGPSETCMLRLADYLHECDEFDTMPLADNGGNTPAHLAVLSYPPDVVQRLMERLPEVCLNVVNRASLTPLMAAVGASPEMAATVLDCTDVDPMVITPRGTALTVAVKEDDVETTALLLDVTMAVLCVDDITELQTVNRALAAWLRAPDSHGNTVLHVAFEDNRLEVMKVLLLCGPNLPLLVANEAGDHPLALALRKGHYNLLDLLYDSGPELQDAVYAALQLHDGDRWTACHHLSRLGDAYLMNKFITFSGPRFNPDQVTRLGETPLHIAVADNNREMVTILLAHGAQAVPTIDGYYPVHTAVQHNRVDLFQLLLTTQHASDPIAKMYTRVEPKLSLVELATEHRSFGILGALKRVDGAWADLLTNSPVGLMLHSLLPDVDPLQALPESYVAAVDQLWKSVTDEETNATASTNDAARDTIVEAQLFIDSLTRASGPRDQFDPYVRTLYALVDLLTGTISGSSLSALLNLSEGLRDACVTRASVSLIAHLLSLGADVTFGDVAERPAAHLVVQPSSLFTRYVLPLLVSQGSDLTAPAGDDSTPLMLLTGDWSSFGLALHCVSDAVPARPRSDHVRRRRMSVAPPETVTVRSDEGTELVIGPAPTFNIADNKTLERPIPAAQGGCTVCGKKFSLLTRRRHCRMCGNAFCDDHCSEKADLPWLGYKSPQRVCHACLLIVATSVTES
ncbi:FYVE zinc finger [Carpediemonas membranifera]|uniref:FYVE zinc finger n=1 Tax=Carpediemonas membranifera TaxID=201153 RepID=A0A8J6AWE3_9EUKA|nr:FYVE zinc finger [Carpediemonas membranifera]|eukprot:KAG9396541.1 FYVE zinc finger [Carpediemonas membranifera]